MTFQLPHHPWRSATPPIGIANWLFFLFQVVDFIMIITTTPPTGIANWLFFVFQIVDFIIIITKVVTVEEIDIFWQKQLFFSAWKEIAVFFFYLGFLSRTFTSNRTAGEGEGISVFPHYHFHLLHRHLGISRAIIYLFIILFIYLYFI